MGRVFKSKLLLVLALAAVAAMALGIAPRPALAVSFQSIFGSSEPEPKFNLIHVQDLARLMRDPQAKFYLYDVNPVDTRESTGIIPGAKLLASDDSYDLSELPPDKSAKLIFYCHNVH
jgi:hypothetical protein